MIAPSRMVRSWAALCLVVTGPLFAPLACAQDSAAIEAILERLERLEQAQRE